LTGDLPARRSRETRFSTLAEISAIARYREMAEIRRGGKLCHKPRRQRINHRNSVAESRRKLVKTWQTQTRRRGTQSIAPEINQ